MIVIGIFVDDLLVTGDSVADIKAVRDRMNERFISTDQGRLEYYLGAIVRSLLHLYQWTRPDLGFAVTFLSRYLHKPCEKHLLAAKHVPHYLKGMIDLGFRYTRDLARLHARDQQLNVFCPLRRDCAWRLLLRD